MSALLRLSLAFLFVSAASATAFADKRGDETKKQKTAAEANIKSAMLTAAHVETDDLLVYATMPEAKAKPLAAAMQKTYAVAVKSLKVESSDKLWPGKLTVYVFSDTRQYKSFALQAFKRQPPKQESFFSDTKGDVPYVLDGAVLGEKPTDVQIATEASSLVAAAVLVRQVGSLMDKTPTWLQLGFGQAAYLRADGNAAKLTAHKAKLRAMYTKNQGQSFKVANVTGDQATADAELLSVSLAEYLAFGPNAAKFPMILGALKPSDDQPNPTFDTALAAADWKWMDLETAWQKWVFTGK